jgi:hypothetical protein
LLALLVAHHILHVSRISFKMAEMMAPPVILRYFRLLNYESFSNGLYFSLNLIWVIKSTRMRWMGQVARMGEGRDAYRALVGRPERKRSLARPRRRWEDNTEWVFRKWDVRTWTGSSWLRIGAGGGHL